MSRVANNPISIPKGVEVTIADGIVTAKGKNGLLSRTVPAELGVDLEGGTLSIRYNKNDQRQNALAGTTRANLANMIVGVSNGFERKLSLVGVGYRAQAKGDVLSLSLGFSHPVEFKVPAGVVVETPSQTDIVVKGADRQVVGQVAADIRAFRAPEPYKGKGVRYADEVIIRKEAKKK
ncbi:MULTISPECIES: 50S ribosomal protein L6 [Methylococcus]|jgi:large subunit ribosomal protein L6|uniref:Large ribosomal subunit protein uL6 n=2 Tax=Methylococcus capsulatus TaxID=414 RepID=RL6_METCA|nr:50S ribosomal protein L6 [Methylococcus capsulatus]Q605C7.1 RecName: Full=Large ribosomal subunit protein uL6; AltName: Full=50S ribosomal protein L6 [Methylococcus capsulatus str. Bath]AAU91484.1 ribosomal protein L6 [Methylococcus capsulatus str. Bath]QXP87066.1 50S ribosomal protein L6 [Methylococcus capsulatus]QXP91587.1 50S ribosomal protein L6 [Methylococcus capsulatus]QXP93254.1 50S ribosomal protein L6 [Methylococcus capsulatus]UQN12051.1 50S ribosomal protein L6 [Methylococcus cap